MAIGFYFTSQGRQIQLPVNPETVMVQRPSNNRQFEVVKLGEINLLKGTRLAKIDLEFLLPGHAGYPFITGGWNAPQVYIAFFQEAMDNGQTVKLTVTDLGISLKMAVENLETTVRAGDHDSVVCALSLREYRNYGASVVYIPDAKPTSQVAVSREVDKPASEIHILKKGETLWDVAQKQLGKGSSYEDIAKANNLTPASKVEAGTVLKVPTKKPMVSYVPVKPGPLQQV